MGAHDFEYNSMPLFARKTGNINTSMSAATELALVPASRYYCQVRLGDQDYSCSMLLYHVISTTCSHAGGWGSTALAGHSSRSMLVSTQN